MDSFESFRCPCLLDTCRLELQKQQHSLLLPPSSDLTFGLVAALYQGRPLHALLPPSRPHGGGGGKQKETSGLRGGERGRESIRLRLSLFPSFPRVSRGFYVLASLANFTSGERERGRDEAGRHLMRCAVSPPHLLALPAGGRSECITCCFRRRIGLRRTLSIREHTRNLAAWRKLDGSRAGPGGHGRSLSSSLARPRRKSAARTWRCFDTWA